MCRPGWSNNIRSTVAGYFYPQVEIEASEVDHKPLKNRYDPSYILGWVILICAHEKEDEASTEG
jgi:hypothetical protein